MRSDHQTNRKTRTTTQWPQKVSHCQIITILTALISVNLSTKEQQESYKLEFNTPHVTQFSDFITMPISMIWVK